MLHDRNRFLSCLMWQCGKVEVPGLKCTREKAPISRQIGNLGQLGPTLGNFGQSTNWSTDTPNVRVRSWCHAQGTE
jgi:hypothetical protein